MIGLSTGLSIGGNKSGRAFPESTLGAYTSHPIGEIDGQVASTGPKTYAMDFTSLNGSAGGLILEVGGAGDGAYIGFETDGVFVARCGNGGAQWQTETLRSLYTAGAVSGNGTLVVAFSQTAYPRVWWQGAELTASVQGGSTITGFIHGANVAHYLTDAEFSLVTDQEFTPVSYGTASNLREYSGSAPS